MAILSRLKDELECGNDGLNHVNHSVSCFYQDFGLKDGVLDECKGTLERVFDQVIPIYLREVSVGKISRPLPALLGDGQPVDLFRLFWVVKKKGGFNSVSESGLWGSVAEECFLSATLTASLKMLYLKYLKEFDGWLQQVFRGKISENYVVEILKKLELLKVEAKELKGLLWSDEDKKRDDGELGLNFDDKTGSSVEVTNGKHRSQLSDGSIFNKVHHNKKFFYDETESCVDFGTCTNGLLLCNGCDDLNKVDHIVESSNDSEKYMCIQSDESIMSSAKCTDDNAMSSKRIKLGLKVGVDKVQDKVEASRSDNDNKELAGQDDYDILCLARSVVNNVVSSMKSEFCSLPEVDNVKNTCDDDENFDDCDLILSARRIADKFASSQDEGKNMWPSEAINGVRGNAESNRDDCGKVQVREDASNELSMPSVGNEVALSRKRKWESTSLPEMLNWITHAAKHSDDPAIGKVPDPSKWNDLETDECWMQALLAREALLIKRPTANFEEAPLQKKLKMHPSMYEDINAVYQSAERVRCSKRIPLSKSQFCPCCNQGASSQSKVASPRKAQTHDRKLKSSAEVSSSPALDDSHKEVPYERHVSVGPTYQAEVPKWTGAVSVSDSKWLGKRVWTPEDENEKTLVEKHPIGKGRETSCDCSLPGSSSCVGLHIAEKRLELKRALGGLFYCWRFDRMGEEVSLSWTPEEKKRFKKMVLENTAHNKFWKNAFKLFPSKTREKLVSYYFNVLVLRRRSYQNRVTPKHIDSDDDETDFGSVGGSAFLEGSNLPECSLSMQNTDLE
ncbi:hypothetical protein DCAR_0105013 [Daucus carota subsp. sativus]|uniref:ARID domain-containing protein n=1 Tax=Daucus carota subsp. sativus TaxID=79200 RepID=A0AAF0W9K8_DAUCS|nr:PREDICTED: AT-rich interactive domain-containing protein 2-like [Daucus carota subsp. sativus]WOG85820.1 hypothetical protein DCAR_0105013 [Daucus carota subsp. sativus]